MTSNVPRGPRSRMVKDAAYIVLCGGLMGVIVFLLFTVGVAVL